MPQLSHIVCVGRDAHILDIRCRVLRTRYRVECVQYPDPGQEPELRALDAPLELIVLCHSLSREECNLIAERFRARHPGCPVLSISAPGHYGTADHSDAVVAALAGPDGLHHEVERLLESRTAAAR